MNIENIALIMVRCYGIIGAAILIYMAYLCREINQGFKEQEKSLNKIRGVFTKKSLN